MAVKLPPPLNKCLTLWLPPKFAKTEDNTLGYVLRQEDLTWEALVVSRNIRGHRLIVAGPAAHLCGESTRTLLIPQSNAIASPIPSPSTRTPVLLLSTRHLHLLRLVASLDAADRTLGIRLVPQREMGTHPKRCRARTRRLVHLIC